MTYRSVRFGLSLFITLGFVARVVGQAPLVPSATPVDDSPPVPLALLLQKGPTPQPTPGHLVQKMNQHGYCCASNPSWFGCGNIRTELTFILGSCRTFFGETCIPPVPRNQRGDPAFR